MRGRSRAHRAAEDNHVLLVNAQNLGEKVEDVDAVVEDVFFVRLEHMFVVGFIRVKITAISLANQLGHRGSAARLTTKATFNLAPVNLRSLFGNRGLLGETKFNLFESFLELTGDRLAILVALLMVLSVEAVARVLDGDDVDFEHSSHAVEQFVREHDVFRVRVEVKQQFGRATLVGHVEARDEVGDALAVVLTVKLFHQGQPFLPEEYFVEVCFRLLGLLLTGFFELLGKRPELAEHLPLRSDF